MDLMQTNPHVRYARFHPNVKFRTELSLAYDCRLFYMKQGSGVMLAGGKNYEFSDNTALFVPPGIEYQFFLTEDENLPGMMVFNFDLISDFSHLKGSLGTATQANYQPERAPVYTLPEEFSGVITQHAPQLYELLQKCIDEFITHNRYYRETVSALLKWCLVQLLRESAAGSEFKIITQVTEYIHEHYEESSLTNGDIADRFNYHPYYLSQLMKQATGETLHSYLLHYRLRIAKNYLITTDWDVNTISWKCGFNSAAYFIKQFKLRTGVTPRQYRKAHMNLVF